MCIIALNGPNNEKENESMASNNVTYFSQSLNDY